MTQLHWLLSDSVEDLKPISQVQNHTGVNLVIDDVISELPAAIVSRNIRQCYTLFR